MRYENSCVYYFTRCIRGNITGISFSFFFEATSNIQPPYHGFDWEYTIVPLELKPASVMRNSINSLSSERHIANVYTSPMRRCVSLCRDAEGNLNFWGRGRDMHNKFFWASSKIPRNISNRSNFPLFAYSLFSFLSFSTHFYNIGFVLFWNFYIQLMEELCVFAKYL